MGETPVTIVEIPKEGPKIGFWLPWSAIAISISGIVYVTYRAAQFEATVVGMDKSIARIEAGMITRPDIDMLRQTDRYLEMRIDAFERRQTDLTNLHSHNGLGTTRPR